MPRTQKPFRYGMRSLDAPALSAKEQLLRILGGNSMFHTARPKEQDKTIKEAHEKERPDSAAPKRSLARPPVAKPASEQKVPRGKKSTPPRGLKGGATLGLAKWRKHQREFLIRAQARLAQQRAERNDQD